jgi:hypothetical protein
MSQNEIKCFVIMPFLPELHFFYLFIREHIQKKFKFINVSRADDLNLTKGMLEKINGMILGSDIIIADCSGKNANVMYELGIAHSTGKDVILITKDDIKEAPTDIRYYEFIKYALDDDKNFTSKLDNALLNLIKRYDDLYDKARILFDKFKSTTGLDVQLATKDLFVSRVNPREIPDSEGVMLEFLLPRIIADLSNTLVIGKIMEYVERNRETQISYRRER